MIIRINPDLPKWMQILASIITGILLVVITGILVLLLLDLVFDAGFIAK